MPDWQQHAPDTSTYTAAINGEAANDATLRHIAQSYTWCMLDAKGLPLSPSITSLNIFLRLSCVLAVMALHAYSYCTYRYCLQGCNEWARCTACAWFINSRTVPCQRVFSDINQRDGMLVPQGVRKTHGIYSMICSVSKQSSDAARVHSVRAFLFVGSYIQIV